MTPSVLLTACELLLARQVAAMRVVQNLRRGAKDRNGAENEDNDGIHIRGCIGEMAASKMLNLFWSGGVGIYGVPDVGGVLDVRSVEGPARRLIIHPGDVDDRPYLLARLIAPDAVTFPGWVYGRGGKRPEWRQDPTGKGRHAYFVPNEALMPLSSLIEAIPSLLAKPEAAA